MSSSEATSAHDGDTTATTRKRKRIHASSARAKAPSPPQPSPTPSPPSPLIPATPPPQQARSKSSACTHPRSTPCTVPASSPGRTRAGRDRTRAPAQPPLIALACDDESVPVPGTQQWARALAILRAAMFVPAPAGCVRAGGARRLGRAAAELHPAWSVDVHPSYCKGLWAGRVRW